MTPQAVYLYRPEQPFRAWLIYFSVSLVIHICIAALLLIAPAGSSSHVQVDRSETIDVELVSSMPQPQAPAAESLQTPTPEALASKSGGAEAEAEPAEPDKPPVKSGMEKQIDSSDYVLETPDQKSDQQSDQKSAEPAAEPKVKTSLKKKTFQREKAIDHAVQQIQEKSEKSRPQSVQQRIEQMKGEVDDLAYKGRLNEDDKKQSGRAGRQGDYSQLQVYQAEVAVEMKRNWAFSEELAGNTRGLESRLVIKIMPDGSIADVWFEKRSGNTYLDESAYKTVMKSDPLPPLPDGYPYYHLVLGFTPRGLK